MKRLNTKENRIELQKYFFQSLIKEGFTRENYKDLIIFRNPVKLEYKIFRGTSTKSICYFRSSSLESMEKSIQGYKNNADRREAYKAEAKANPTTSTAANCAAAIRTELKTAFPDIKFTVKSDNFSGGNSVNIGWVDGATTGQIDKIVNKYQYGHFNGMEDIYEYSNSRTDLPQVKFVSTSRTISDKVNEVVFNSLKNNYSEDTPDYVINQDKHRLIYNTFIPVGGIVTGVEHTGKNGTIDDFYRLVIDVTNVKTINKKSIIEKNPNFEAVELTPGTVQLIEYSEKSIAVIGDTKRLKEGLKDLGGKFNFRLSCGAGWIFPKTKTEEVTLFLSSAKTKIDDDPSAEVLAEAMETEKTNSGLEKTTLKDEIQKTIEFFAETDLKIYGEVTEGTKEAAKVQNVDLYDKNEVEIYNSVEDLENAAEKGKVISLLNYSNLLNKKNTLNC